MRENSENINAIDNMNSERLAISSTSLN